MQFGVMLHLTATPGEDAASVYRHYTEVVRHAEALGLHEAWVTEHHFDARSLGAAPHLLMAHFLAHSQQIKLGSAATLLGFHNPLSIAEELATLSALAPGRVLAGFAKGGPFESQKRAFRIDGDSARQKMLEALPAIAQLLQHGQGAHLGEHYQWETLDLHPRCAAVPFFIASADAASMTVAAQHDFGLMGAQFWPLARIVRMREAYMQQHLQGRAPDLMLARGLLIDDDAAQAKSLALQRIHDFRAQKARLWGAHKGPMAEMPDDALLDMMLVGTPQDVAQGVLKLRAAGVTRLALNPLTENHAVLTRQLERFVQQVLPLCGLSLRTEAAKG